MSDTANNAEYMDRLSSERTHEALLCERLAVALVIRTDQTLDERAGTLDALRSASRRRDALTRQISWHNRRTAISSPAEPAWVD